MRENLQILLLEDNPGDARLIQEYLKESRREMFSLVNAATLAAGLEHLKTSSPDVILLDLGLPDSQGLNTLETVILNTPHIPVIILTGLNNAEMAVQAVHAGAQDYLAKGEFTSDFLIRVIRYAVERKQAENRLRKNETDLKKAQQAAHVGSWIWHIQTNQLEWSDEMHRIFGLDKSEFTGDLSDVMQRSIHPDDWPAVEASNRLVIEQKKPTPLEYRIILPDGSQRVVWAEAGELQLDEEGLPALLSGIVRDITDSDRQKNEILQRNQEINLLYEAGRQISESLNLEIIYQTFHEFVSRNMQCDMLVIASFDAHTQLISAAFAISEGKPVEVSAIPPIPLEPEGYGIQSPVIRSGMARNIGDYQEELKNTNTNYYIDNEGAIAGGRRVPEDGQYTQSAMIIPMKLNNQVIGVVQIQSYQKNAYSQDDFRIAQSLVSQIAVAANNATLYKQSLLEIEIRKQAENTVYQLAAELNINNEKLTRLYNVSNTLIQGSSLNREGLTQLVVDTIAEDIGQVCCSLYLINPGASKLVLAASSNSSLKNCIPPAVDLKTAPLFSRVIEKKEKITINDTGEHPVEGANLENTRSLLLIPLEVSQQAKGVVMIQSPCSGFFTAEDEQLVNLFTSQAAIVLENANLLSEMIMQLNRVEALHTIDDAINASLDLEITTSILVEQVKSQLKVDAAAILLLNPVSETFEYINGCGFNTNALQITRLPLGRAALDRQIVHIEDLSSYNEFIAASRLLEEEQFIEYYGVPLISKGNVKGLLEIFHRSRLKTNASWFEFLETLAGQAAIAVDNIQLFENLQTSNNELIMAYDATIEGWSRAMDLRDKETEGHTERVTAITVRLAKSLGIQGEELTHIRRGALLHDIGKMGIPDSILLKPGPLTDEEWGIMRRHPDYAYELISPIAFLKPALDIPYCHHEKWDGSGYPRGLKGDQIPLSARLFAVADVWDALTSHRPYREAWPERQTLDYLRAQSGKHFDPRAVEVFLANFRPKESSG